jgi:hypothetical protein
MRREERGHEARVPAGEEKLEPPRRLAPAIATDLYWSLPTPKATIDAICAQALANHWVVLRLPAVNIAGLNTAVSGALERIHLDRQRTRWLKIDDGMSVPIGIGAALTRTAVTAKELASATSSVRAIVLEAKSRSAVEKCEEYLGAYAQELSGTACDAPKLIALLPEPGDVTREPGSGAPHEIIFSGALTVEEMAAYVSVRMIDRSGPAETGLLRRLVSEFAGFDAFLAEELMDLPDDQLLGLPASLESMAARSEARWGSGRWSQLCYAQVNGRKARHVLHEIYLVRHPGPEQRDAAESLKRRYWRACARSLLPWLEERRSRVIAFLRPALEEHLKSFGGKVVRTTPSGRRIETAIEEIEYNQIPGMIYNDGFKPPNDMKGRQAVDVCFAAKPVRDDIAHMRPPRAQAILDITERMQRLLTT